MKRWCEFVAALAISAGLHASAGIGIGLMLDWTDRTMAVPTLVEGDSSVLVTFAEPLVDMPVRTSVMVPPVAPQELPASVSVEPPPAPVVVEPPPAPVSVEPLSATVVVESPPPEPPAPKPDPVISLPPSPAPSIGVPLTPIAAPAQTLAHASAAPTVFPSECPSTRISAAIPDNRPKGVQELEDFDTDLRPVYPMSARLRDEEGSVRILVELTRSGRARKVTVENSSGVASLDKAALAAIRKARFQAKSGAILEGTNVRLSIRFSLTDADHHP